MPRDPEAMADAILRGVPEKTGRPVDHWLELIRSRPELKPGQVQRWLKEDFGIGASTASVLYQRATARPGGEPSKAEMVDAQYAGAKAGLRPIYERLVSEAGKLGDDAVLEVRRSYVGLARRRAFAAIVPAASDRVDLGLRLPEVAPTARLEGRGAGGGSLDRRVALRSVDDVDAEVLGWLRQAHEGAG